MASQMDSRTENTRVWCAARYEHLDTSSPSTSNKGCLALIAALAMTLAGSGLIVYALTGGLQ